MYRYSHYYTAKFNCLVPGTLPTSSSECIQIATNPINSTTLSPTSPTSVVHDLITLVTDMSTLPPTSFDISHFESSSITGTILVIVPLVGGATILNISIVMVCMLIWFRHSRKRQLNSSVVAQLQSQGITFF